MAQYKPQNWITAYTPVDVEYVLKNHGSISDEEICKELNITELTLKEILNVNKQPTTNDTKR